MGPMGHVIFLKGDPPKLWGYTDLADRWLVDDQHDLINLPGWVPSQ